ncbi:MAG TPA: metallophosphoesterase [Fibrobacteria bacterium]|nr:metallophosphoesterase [Fibrobacteria bacterium]
MSQSIFSEVGRVLAIGDLHGNYSGFKRILQETGLIDKRGHWKARNTHLVQLGDILGRGGEPGKIFNLLKRLETESRECDSRVHVLLGNHEAMSMSGLIIYNTMEEFQDLAGEDLLEEGFQGARKRPLPERPAPAAAKSSAPDAKPGKRLDVPGCKEFRAALSPRGKVGSWLVDHDSAVSVNGYLFVHGGLNRDHGCMPLEDLNDRVRRELRDDGAPQAGKDIMLRRDGPQWNREFTLKPTEARRLELEEVLDYHHCRRMVVGHTPTSCIDPGRAGRILPMYGDRLYCIDTGIGKTYGQNLSALNVERGAVSALYF